jgi:glutathione peroxidase
MQKLMGGVCAGLLVLLGFASFSRADNKGDKAVPPVLNFKMNSLDGQPVDLSKYHGKVILMVNVASKCGYTPQYKGLEALYEKYGNEGFVILGFPANNFLSQEPGTNEQIAEFCQSKYGVKFDMFSKVSVKGDDQCPLYQFLTSKDTNPKFGGPVKWNFEKFLINSKGEIVNRFRSPVKPDSPEMTRAIESELAKK